jgi:hypothetical protein
MAKCLETIEDSEGSWECKRWREDELIHDGMQVACRYGFVWNRSGTAMRRKSAMSISKEKMRAR